MSATRRSTRKRRENADEESEYQSDSSSGSVSKPPRSASMTGFPAAWVAHAHTILVSCGFVAALIVACSLHYYKVVKNEVAGYPEEWFPTISATIGDWYPERNIFQIFMAISAGPRFALIALNYLATAHPSVSLTTRQVVAVLALLRTLCAGGWIYITSSDSHDVHEPAMILYLFFGLLYFIGTIIVLRRLEITRPGSTSLRYRVAFLTMFLVTIPVMVYLYIRHKVNHIPGAYSIYAVFEWSLIAWDVGFDAFAAVDLKGLDIGLGNSLPTPQRQKSVSSKSSIPSNSVGISILSLISDSILGYAFWSLLAMGPLTVWFFPLWDLALTGWELIFFSTISPVILAFTPLKPYLVKYEPLLHLFSLVGVLSGLHPDPLTRLIMVGIGAGFTAVAWTIKLVRSKNSVIGWLLGLILCNIMKYGWWSRDPIWSIMKPSTGIHVLATVLGAIASIALFTRSEYRQTTDIQPVLKKEKQNGKSWFKASLGFAATLFFVHNNLIDTTAIIRWPVEGYPVFGPDPVYFGPVVIIFAAVGVLLAINDKRASLFTERNAVVFATVALFGHYYLRAYLGFVCGLIWMIWFITVLPIVVGDIKNYPLGKTVGTSMFLYHLLSFASIWTVAYAFVPAGWLLRERTHVVIAFAQFFLMMGITNAQRGSSPFDRRNVSLGSPGVTRKMISTLLMFFALLLVFATQRISNKLTEVIAPYHGEQRIITGGIWTIHFGLDNDGYDSCDRMAILIQELELDVIGLLESDTARSVGGNRDLSQYLAEQLHMYADFGPSPTKHTWGCTMLSKYPIKKSTHHLLPSPVGELACAIHATLDVFGTDVDVIISHNGQEEDWVDRQLQTDTLASIMNASQNPFIFMGYVVTKPHDILYKKLTEVGRMTDVEPSDDDRWCQYIMYRGVKRVAYARVSHGGITDTEVQTGKFIIGDGTEQNPDWWKDQSGRVSEREVPASMWYPTQFRGQGSRGHRYHVFNEPWYYN